MGCTSQCIGERRSSLLPAQVGSLCIKLLLIYSADLLLNARPLVPLMVSSLMLLLLLLLLLPRRGLDSVLALLPRRGLTFTAAEPA